VPPSYGLSNARYGVFERAEQRARKPVAVGWVSARPARVDSWAAACSIVLSISPARLRGTSAALLS
tara:strand:- start:562 stop:759 length:198 start_codon:yes stop_codon:yes gene_type:complete